MSIPSFAVRRRVTVVMIVIAMVVLGAVSIFRLPLTLLPDLNLPAAAVIVEYPNVGPWEVEAQVTRPIEEVIATVSNVSRVSSISETGRATIVAQFNWGTDMDFATLEMRERLDLIQGYLPDAVEKPQVFKFDPSINPIFQFNIGGREDLSEIRRFAEDVIKPRLESIDGVASVTIEGGSEREIRVELDPLRLEQYNITIETVMQALAAGNLNYPVGTMSAHGREFTVRTVGEFASLDEIAKTVVNVGPGGVVRIEDIARVADTYKPETRLTRLNGTPSVSVSMQKESEANTVTVSNRIRAELDRLIEEYGETMQFQVVWDDADMIRMSIRTVIENGLMGGLIAMAVLFVFLGSISPTLVIGIAIPVSAIATFFFLYLFDVTLNVISLGGLALGIGMLVDNSIVSLENVVRHRQLGASPVDASIKGAEEIMGALTGSTLTTIAVFLPIVFVGGLASQIFNDLALAITFSLVLSLIVAITFVPMVATYMRVRDVATTGLPAVLSTRLLRWYRRTLAWLLDRKGLVFGTALALGAAALALFFGVGREFLPAMDTGQLRIEVELPYGTPVETTDRLATEVEALLARVPEVRSIATTVADERAELFVDVAPAGQRKRRLDEIAEEVRGLLAIVRGADIRVIQADPFGLSELESADINILVKGHDIEELERAAGAVADLVRTVPGTREVRTSLTEGRPELQIRIDRDRASQYGLTVYQIASSARMAVDGAVATRYRLGGTEGREIDVTVQLAEEWRKDADNLARLLIHTPLGTNVRLGDVGTFTEGRGLAEVQRDGGSRAVRVLADVVGRDINSVAEEIKAALPSLGLPDEITVSFGGDVAEMLDAFSELGFALVLAVILVYMILAGQFESYIQPFIIMFTVPLAFIGVVFGMRLSGFTLNVASMIGLIILVGIVVNNGIVLIDFINQLVRRGRPVREAVLEGATARLRPVLMTTLTTVLAMLPMIFSRGEGAELQGPLAIVVVSGLSFSTLLTLGFVPALYEVFAQLRVRTDRSRSSAAEGAAEAGSM